MRFYILILSVVSTVSVFGQANQTESEISSLQSITYQGLSFIQKPYKRLNCEYANLRKKNNKFEWWGDTVCTSVSYVDLQILGEDTAIIRKIKSQIEGITLVREEKVYNNPEQYCREIADTAAAIGMLDLYVEISVMDTFDKFISLNIGTNEFSGGAHPNYYSVVKNFDLISGNVIELFQIIDKKFQKNFQKLLYVKFKKAYGLDALFTPDVKPDEFPLPENFILGNSGMTLLYNPYEITPYVVGMPEISLSFSEIMPYMTPYFKSAASKIKSIPKRK